MQAAAAGGSEAAVPDIVDTDRAAVRGQTAGDNTTIRLVGIVNSAGVTPDVYNEFCDRACSKMKVGQVRGADLIEAFKFYYKKGEQMKTKITNIKPNKHEIQECERLLEKVKSIAALSESHVLNTSTTRSVIVSVNALILKCNTAMIDHLVRIDLGWAFDNRALATIGYILSNNRTLHCLEIPTEQRTGQHSYGVVDTDA